MTEEIAILLHENIKLNFFYRSLIFFLPGYGLV